MAACNKLDLLCFWSVWRTWHYHEKRPILLSVVPNIFILHLFGQALGIVPINCTYLFWCNQRSLTDTILPECYGGWRLNELQNKYVQMEGRKDEILSNSRLLSCIKDLTVLKELAGTFDCGSILCYWVVAISCFHRARLDKDCTVLISSPTHHLCLPKWRHIPNPILVSWG